MLNEVIMMGRLCADPELRFTPQQTAVCTVRLACDRDYTKPDGTRDADFVEFVCWKGLAEFVSRNFRKGQTIAAKGRLQSRKWTDKYQQSRTEYEVIAEDVYFAEKPVKQETSTPAPPPTPAPVPTPAPRNDGYASVYADDDDVPF